MTTSRGLLTRAILAVPQIGYRTGDPPLPGRRPPHADSVSRTLVAALLALALLTASYAGAGRGRRRGPVLVPGCVSLTFDDGPSHDA